MRFREVFAGVPCLTDFAFLLGRPSDAGVAGGLESCCGSFDFLDECAADADERVVLAIVHNRFVWLSAGSSPRDKSCSDAKIWYLSDN